MTELITTKEAASILNRTPLTVKKYIQTRKLVPDQKIGAENFFEKEKVLYFKSSLSSKKTSPTRRLNSRSSFKTRVSHGLPESELIGVVEKWGVNAEDSSSADVEIGVLTERISQIESELRRISIEDSDFRNMRYKLLWHVGERRKLLKYLEMSDFRRYLKAVEMLKGESS